MAYEKHQLQYWLNELGSAFGAQFTLNDKGRCTLQVDNNTSLALLTDENNKAYSITCHLMDLQELNREQVFSQALSLNLNQIETSGAAIALDQKHNALMLCYTADVDRTEYQDFKNTLDNFVDKAEQLIQTLNVSPNTTGTNTSAAPDALFGMLRI
ncbi:type III secretion system chaperone [Thalassomonas viridans]|uniref:Type III secretion system chaperone n=1 Tax=Thalassomonas viridans TaxID=137584 RepID=A0AAE9Z916_9GAMM|nr:CesT family type III secretion system chaperone [Thalassomonas viridans]WDE08995.1 type III secretion system chaperone [Thalassomonas viridans]